MSNRSASQPRPTFDAFGQLKRLLAAPRHDLKWHYEVGLLVKQLVPGKRYGRGDMQRIAKRLRRLPNYGLVLYQHRDFVRAYKRRELPKLRGLTFAHICILQGIDESLREKFRRLCVAPLARGKRVWSVRLLRAKVQESIGKRSRGGRPVEAVLDVGPQTALRGLVQLSDHWQKQYAEPFQKHLNRLIKKIKEEPTEELLALAERGRHALRAVSTDTDRICQRLDKLTLLVRAARKTKSRR